MLFRSGSNSQLKNTVGVCWNLDASFLASFLTDIERYQTYFCGPTPIARAIKKATVVNSSAAVNFTFAKVSVCGLEIRLLLSCVQEHF